MLKKKHRTIPVFVPEMACPFRCIYCNQQVITGQTALPSDEEIVETVEQYLKTMPEEAEVEVGFFGGTFTGIAKAEQERMLRLVRPYLERGDVKSVRLSTRPDYIDEEIVALLKAGGVGTVELGVQSMDDEVLRKVHRGYDSTRVREAVACIQRAGMEAGMQMMIGLPGDTKEKSLATAREIVRIGATNTRIYPTLVVKETALARMWERGEYEALSVEEAVDWCKDLLRLFEENGVTALRVGLHPTEGFISGTDYLAGPFHVAFKELVETEIMRDEILKATEGMRGGRVRIAVGRRMVNAAAGHGGKNKKELEHRFTAVNIVADDGLEGYEVIVEAGE